MTNVYPLPPQKRSLDEASDWLARLDRGLSLAEQQALERWLAQHPENRRSLLRLASLWDRMGSLSRLAALFPAGHEPRSRRLFYPAIAASLALIVLSAWLIVQRLADASLEDRVFANVAEAYETQIGERSSVRLPDHSMLTLNTNSRVQMTYDARERVLTLERGELSIEVAHDARRPFSVIAGEKIVRAVGTAFNVQIVEEGQVELIVTEGTVVVADDPARGRAGGTAEQPPALGTTRTVTKGQRVLLGVDQEIISKVSDLALTAELSWRQGNLIFRGETLDVAIAEVGRYTPVKFEIADERLKQLRIGGMFKAGDVDGLLATLKENFNIDAERPDAQRVRLKAQ